MEEKREELDAEIGKEEKKEKEDLLKKRKEKLAISLKAFFKKKEFYYILLILVIMFGVFLRVQNLPLLKNEATGDYIPLELDSFLFLRTSQYLVDHNGTLFQTDMQRYYPLGDDPRVENIFVSYVIVYIYKIMQVFSPTTTLGLADIIYPLIFFILAAIAFYFLVKELFNKKIAIVATLILTIMPAYIYRTMLGFADKEPLGLFFMYLALYLYIKSLKTENLYISLFYGCLSGISTGLMGLSWGGVKFLVVIIALSNIALFLFNKSEKKDLYIYAAWTVSFSIVLSFFTIRYNGIKGLASSTTTGIVYIILFVMVLALILERFKLLDKINLPKSISVILIILVIGIIASIILMNTALKESSLFSMGNDVINLLTSGGFGKDRLSLTVAENKQPYVVDWISQFGFLFLFFLIGAVILFYNLIRPLGKYLARITAAFAGFLILFIFSSYSSDSILNGANLFSIILYFGSAALFGLMLFAIFMLFYYKDKESYEKLKGIDKYAIFFFVWTFVMIVAGRSAIRLLLMLAPVIAILSAFFFFEILKYAKDVKDKIYKRSIVIGAIIVLILVILSNSASSYSSAKSTYPPYTPQWQNAMDWVSKNTPEKSVFAHWWDYGYWVQTGGGRATITDGGNYYPYWNHLMGRHVLAAKTDEEALTFLKSHNATHLLIISDEIGKYTAYSSIGSDENFDIFSWISTFVLDPRATTKKGDTMTYYFVGGTALDENFVYNGKVFPQKKSYIAGFMMPVKETEDDYEIQQPKAILYYQNQREEVPIECVYDKKKIFFNETGMKGCLRIIPRILPGYQYQQENGAALWVSRKGMDALWTKLFLFDEKDDNFELIFDDSGKNKLAYYNGNVMGPIKIWKINYPSNLTVDKDLQAEYLALSTPEWMKLNGVTL